VGPFLTMGDKTTLSYAFCQEINEVTGAAPSVPLAGCQ
jgi:hypothetical protein